MTAVNSVPCCDKQGPMSCAAVNNGRGARAVSLDPDDLNLWNFEAGGTDRDLLDMGMGNFLQDLFTDSTG